MANQKLPFGADTPIQFLIHHLVQRLLDLGQEAYIRVWMEQLERAQVTGTFNLQDAIISLEVVQFEIAQKRNGGVA